MPRILFYSHIQATQLLPRHAYNKKAYVQPATTKQQAQAKITSSTNAQFKNTEIMYNSLILILILVLILNPRIQLSHLPPSPPPSNKIVIFALSSTLPIITTMTNAHTHTHKTHYAESFVSHSFARNKTADKTNKQTRKRQPARGNTHSQRHATQLI